MTLNKNTAQFSANSLTRKNAIFSDPAVTFEPEQEVRGKQIDKILDLLVSPIIICFPPSLLEKKLTNILQQIRNCQSTHEGEGQHLL